MTDLRGDNPSYNDEDELPTRKGRRVQKHKRVAKPLMVALPMIMIDELGDRPALGS